MVDVKIEGMEALLKKLKKLPFALQNNVLSGAIRAGAKLVADDARARVAVHSEHLKKSILVRKRRSKNKTILHFTIAPVTKILHQFQDASGQKHYNYGNIVEEGRSASAVEHGASNMVAQPFMAPAFESKGTESIDATRKYMAARLDKEIKKL
jgi:HK97 gp10 family phage protein